MKKILLYNSGGGLGDSIQLFSLILSLQNHFKTSEFYYLGAHENHLQGKLKDFKINVKTLDLNLKYFGFRWWHLFFVKKNFLKTKLDKFDLIIDLQSKLRNTLILKRVPHDHFYSTTYNFRFCTKDYDFNSTDHLENLINFLKMNLKIVKFNIKSLDDKYKLEAKRLLPDKNYVGFSITQGNVYRAKSWALKNFITLACKLEERNKTPVFFVEKKNKELIKEIKQKLPKALFPELHSNIACPALVTAMANRLDLAVSIDNGVMHMIALADVPMVVLFGPTDSDKFAPKNEFVKVIDSKIIYKSKDINKITVHDVFKKI